MQESALIWLTARGHETLRRDREVLSVDQLTRAMARLPADQADELMAGLRTLVDLATRSTTPRHGKNGVRSATDLALAKEPGPT